MSSVTSKNFFNELPEELLPRIFSFSSSEDLNHLTIVSKKIYMLISLSRKIIFEWIYQNPSNVLYVNRAVQSAALFSNDTQKTREIVLTYLFGRIPRSLIFSTQLSSKPLEVVLEHYNASSSVSLWHYLCKTPPESRPQPADFNSAKQIQNHLKELLETHSNKEELSPLINYLQLTKKELPQPPNFLEASLFWALKMRRFAFFESLIALPQMALCNEAPAFRINLYKAWCDHVKTPLGKLLLLQILCKYKFIHQSVLCFYLKDVLDHKEFDSPAHYMIRAAETLIDSFYFDQISSDNLKEMLRRISKKDWDQLLEKILHTPVGKTLFSYQIISNALKEAARFNALKVSARLIKLDNFTKIPLTQCATILSIAAIKSVAFTQLLLDSGRFDRADSHIQKIINENANILPETQKLLEDKLSFESPPKKRPKLK